MALPAAHVNHKVRVVITRHEVAVIADTERFTAGAKLQVRAVVGAPKLWGEATEVCRESLVWKKLLRQSQARRQWLEACRCNHLHAPVFRAHSKEATVRRERHAACLSSMPADAGLRDHPSLHPVISLIGRKLRRRHAGPGHREILAGRPLVQLIGAAGSEHGIIVLMHVRAARQSATGG
jgi:hypothetical protein